MKRILLLALALGLAAGNAVWADDLRGGQGKDEGRPDEKKQDSQPPARDSFRPAASQPAPDPANPAPQPAPNPVNQVRPSTPLSQWTGDRQVHIDVSRPAVHGDANPASFHINRPAPATFPAFNNTNNNQTTARPNPRKPTAWKPVQPLTGAAARLTVPGNVVHHHHSYTPGYVRKKLQKIGVTSIPYPVADRSHLLDTDKQHSILQRLPSKGPDGKPLSTALISARHFNDPVVRNRMTTINGDAQVRAQVSGLAQIETRANHYYWHKAGAASYCHYVDDWGYHWYGWYQGDQCFWTRYYADRWWWYDGDYGRWCFWSDGWWWWQDPYHVGDLYMYDGDQYVSCNSANDQVVVTTVEPQDMAIYRSPDGTRAVKVMGEDKDAFLYDTTIPPSFNPIYLASKVREVQYSDTSNGDPLEIRLTLGDDSVDLFDSLGNPMDLNEAYQGQGTVNPEDPNAPPAGNEVNE